MKTMQIGMRELLGDNLWPIESSHGLQKTSIATREYPCYVFVLCHLMVVPCVGNKNIKQQVILKTELTVVKNDHFKCIIHHD